MYADSIAIAGDTLKSILEEASPGEPLCSELDAALADLEAFCHTPPAKRMLQATVAYLPGIERIPPIPYSLYREYRRTGYWQNYGRVYFKRRANLTAAALRLLLGQDDLLDVVQNYVWSLCEETNWVISYHERHEVDLFAAETAAMLAQLVTALEGKLSGEICQRVRDEIERRVFVPYLERHDEHGWYKGTNNWNGVCNGSIGSAFLLLERDPDRLAEALALVLESLDVFVHTAFEDDGASTEGPGYWQYGLLHFVAFSELLRQRTKGLVDLLAGERMGAIAAYPLKLMLSAGRYANFSDCEQEVSFQPGFICRLAERTGVHELVGVLAKGGAPDEPSSRQLVPSGLMRWNLDIALRTLLWWDGHHPPSPSLTDACLPTAGTARLIARLPGGSPVVAAIKAGHNAENHNHNDVGSLILHVDGETFLCDPGRGLYDSTYFTTRRYENVFASSLGHGVPRIGGCTQSPGQEFRGQIVAYGQGCPAGLDASGPAELGASGPAPTDATPKRVVVEIGQAYDVPDLESARRTIVLSGDDEDGVGWVQDAFAFAGKGVEIEEAFVTWLEVEISGPVAILQGKRHALRLTIEEPAGAVFSLQTLEQECRANERQGVLKRLSFALAPDTEALAKIRLEIRTR